MLLDLETGIRALLARFTKNPAAAWLRWGRNAHYVPQGLSYLERAAKLDNAEAHFELGLYFEGGGYGESLKGQAMDYYRSAAVLGHAEATFRMGEMLCGGIGIAADSEAGRTAYRRAAEMGWRTAAEWLAGAFEKGEGMDPDAEMAAFWHRRAEKLESREPSRSALLHLPTESPRNPLSRIANAIADGLDEWMGEAIHGQWFKWFFWLIIVPCGLLGILGILGTLLAIIGFANVLAPAWVTVAFLSMGFVVPTLFFFFFWLSTGRGMHWSLMGRRHQAKAERGDPEACFKRGMVFLRGGPETPLDGAEARRWLRRAADGGHVEAMVKLAELLRFGHGGMKDSAQAKAWFDLAAEAGHEGAKKALDEIARKDSET